MTEREKFEVFWCEKMNVDEIPLYQTNYPMVKPEDQQYACHDTNRSWLTWVAAAKAATPQWISVKDDLPKHEPGKWSNPVIAMSDTGLVFKLSYCGGWQRTNDFISSGSSEITHWILMPKIAGDNHDQ